MPDGRGSQPCGMVLTSIYTARVGHWAETLEDEVAARLGANVDRSKLRPLLREAGTEIELLAGQRFGPIERRTETMDSGGLPFIDVPSIHVADYKVDNEAWAVPDLVDPTRANVLQLGRFPQLAHRAVGLGEALWIAGHLIAAALKNRWLSPEYLQWLLANGLDHERRLAFFKTLIDPASRVQIPIAATSYGGWWIQISRRLLWVTNRTPDEPRLVVPVFATNEKLRGLVGAEPILIAAPITTHPVNNACIVRIWPPVHRASRPWRMVARAVHAHGIPIVSIDENSTAEEVGCQLVLGALWHQQVPKEELGLASAVASAYPKAVARIMRSASMPNTQSAAALLLEGLLHPGFDPALGAASIRRYVNRKARIAILEHRKADDPGARAWESLGVSERFYYKLLKRHAPKVAGRYQVDDRVLDRIRSYLQEQDGGAEKRRAALDLMQERGFTEAAARKWLQRHRIEDAISARPRRPASRSSRRGAAPIR
jgi:hypothetical protein